MRPKIVLSLLLPVLLVLGVALYMKRSAPAPVPVAAPPITAVGVAPAPVSTPAPAPAPMPAVVANPLTPEERQAAIEVEEQRLSEWQSNKDPQSLSNILADLASPEHEIRLAAIEAAKQFDSTDAIPVLKAMAAQTQDNQDAIAMLQAADFLAIPDITFGPKSDTPPSLTPEQQQAIEQSRETVKARQAARMQGGNPPPGPGPNSPATSGQ